MTAAAVAAGRRHTDGVDGSVGSTAGGEPDPLMSQPDPLMSQLVLLTEQLIRYGIGDLFFNLHWDIDSESTAEPLPSGTGSELGPGAVIAAVNLGCAASVLFEPRYGDKRRVRIDLEPGDAYVISGAARWQWLHGISVAKGLGVARRAVVWRFQRC